MADSDPAAVAADKKRRVMIRLIGAPLIIAALFGILYRDFRSGHWTGLLIVVGTMACISLHELCDMMRLKGIRPFDLLAILALVLLFVSRLPMLQHGVETGYITWAAVGAAILAAVVSMRAGFAVLGATAYTGLSIFIVLIADAWPLAFLFATNKGSDMAAYSVGKLIGRHKMAPRISPNKTWEGAIGGLVVGAGLGAWILLGPMRADLRYSPAILVGIAIIVTVAAQVGDLVKSVIKRWAGVKDSGRLLPEFGGALDMIDSFLISAPVAWVLLRMVR